MGVHMMSMPVTLLSAAAAALINAWLGYRIGQLRRSFKVSVGHGGNEPLERRMRAQANFIENVPLFLLLLAALEISGGNRALLAIVAAVFVLSRVAHAYGMEGGSLQRWRQIGILTTFLATIVLTVWAVICGVEALLGR
jgi:uncharacterized membrane protein YecN with MAPEG domain